ETGRRDPDQLPGKEDGGHARQTEQCRVTERARLPLDCLDDLPFAMSVDDHPQGGDTVYIALPLDVYQIGPFAPLNNKRLALHPVLHLCEWMPDVFLIEPGKQINAGHMLPFVCHSSPTPTLQC